MIEMRTKIDGNIPEFSIPKKSPCELMAKFRAEHLFIAKVVMLGLSCDTAARFRDFYRYVR